MPDFLKYFGSKMPATAFYEIAKYNTSAGGYYRGEVLRYFPVTR